MISSSLGGKDNLLIGEDISKRKESLDTFMSELENCYRRNNITKRVVGLVKSKMVDVEEEQFAQLLREEYNLSKELGFEGLVIKPCGGNSKKVSPYVGDNRSIWMKYKKDKSEFGGMDNLDLIVMGVYNGKGKRKDFFGSFLMGVYDPYTGCIWPTTK